MLSFNIKSWLRRRSIEILGIACVGLACGVVQADTIAIQLITEHYPPYQIVSPSGEITGVRAAFVKRAIKHSALSISEVVMPWARAYYTVLNNRNTCVYSMMRLPFRENKFIWIAEIGETTGNLYASKALQNEIKVNSLVDAKKYVIAVQRNDLVVEVLKQNGFEMQQHMMEVTDWKQSIQLVIHGRADLVVSNKEIMDYYLNELNMPEDTLIPVFTVPAIESAKHYLACNLNSDPDAVLLLKQAFSALQSQQSIHEIKYLSTQKQ